MEKEKINQQFSDLINSVKEKFSTSQIKCKSCGKMMSKDLKFCTWCGNELAAKEIISHASVERIANNCPQCGEQLEEGMAFCTSCGAKLASTSIPLPSRESNIPKTPDEEFSAKASASGFRVCENCGSRITGSVDFCECCGARLDSTFIVQNQEEPTNAASHNVSDNSDMDRGSPTHSDIPDGTRTKTMKSYFRKPGDL